MERNGKEKEGVCIHDECHIVLITENVLRSVFRTTYPSRAISSVPIPRIRGRPSHRSSPRSAYLLRSCVPEDLAERPGQNPTAWRTTRQLSPRLPTWPKVRQSSVSLASPPGFLHRWCLRGPCVSCDDSQRGVYALPQRKRPWRRSWSQCRRASHPWRSTRWGYRIRQGRPCHLLWWW